MDSFFVFAWNATDSVTTYCINSYSASTYRVSKGRLWYVGHSVVSQTTLSHFVASINNEGSK